MTPQAFLHTCAELERAIGGLYRRLAGSVAAHPAVARLFLELADQEDTHAHSIRLMTRLTRGVREGASIEGDAPRVAKAMKDGLARADSLLNRGGDVSPEAALLAAIRIESSLLEAHRPDFMKTDSEQLRGALRILATDTDRHKARLEALLVEVRTVPSSAG